MNCSIVIVQKLKLEVIVIIVMIIIQGKNYNLEKQNCCKKKHSKTSLHLRKWNWKTNKTNDKSDLYPM